MATVARVNSFSVGGWTLTGDQFDNLKILMIQTQLFGTFRVNGASSGYVVPASTELVVVAAAAVARTGAPMTGCMKLGYGDTDVGNAAGSAPTSPVYALPSDGCFGSPGTNDTFDHNSFPIVGPTGQAVSFYFVVPTGKYPFMGTDVNASAVLWGFTRAV